jgi:hypothetical protein
MNILFFGASVTQQSGKSGYVPIFKKIIEDNKFDDNVIQKGYGSMHLNDAGICKIDSIIDEKPNLCFLDWTSTGLIIVDKASLFQYLDTIVRKLMLIKSQICFLLLDRLEMCRNRLLMYDNVKEYCTLYKVHFIELYNNTNINELLRDTVHTNELGAQFYADKIYNFYLNHKMTQNITYTDTDIPNENRYSKIKTLPLNKEIHDEINMIGSFEIIGIFQKIGNFSGIVEIIRNNEKCYKFNIWDQWCHFTRDNIKINVPLSNQVKIIITQDSFNTDDCKVIVNFNEIIKYMHIYEIYYFGDLTII